MKPFKKGSPAKKLTARKDVVPGTVVICFAFGCAETWVCGRKMSRALSLAGVNTVLPPSYKGSNFPMAVISKELATPSEMLTVTETLTQKCLPDYLMM